MKNLIKISVITFIILFFSISHVYAIDMFLTNQHATNNNNDLEIHTSTIEIENELYEENNTDSEVLTTR